MGLGFAEIWQYKLFLGAFKKERRNGRFIMEKMV